MGFLCMTLPLWRTSSTHAFAAFNLVSKSGHVRDSRGETILEWFWSALRRRALVRNSALVCLQRSQRRLAGVDLIERLIWATEQAVAGYHTQKPSG